MSDWDKSWQDWHQNEIKFGLFEKKNHVRAHFAEHWSILSPRFIWFGDNLTRPDIRAKAESQLSVGELMPQLLPLIHGLGSCVGFGLQGGQILNKLD